MRLAAIGLFLIGCALLAAPAPARACKAGPNFVRPTNVELVGKTDVIVVARLVKGAPRLKVHLEVTRVLKGTGVAAGDPLQVRGLVKRYRGPSKPGDLSRARPGAYVGSCTAVDYAVGKSYVLFLERSGASWHTVGTPFARVNEEADAIWLQAIEEYVRVAAIGEPGKRRAALDALVARGTKAGASASDRSIAADVDRHLTKRSKP